MLSVLLDQARLFESEHFPKVSAMLQPYFHLTGGIGWINDPNGFSLYKGEYHLFFQYNPYNTHWDLMHWGHVKTHDFITWEHLPCALAPDKDYDRYGCFSGSAVELRDGRHLLMYTGVTKTDDGHELQQQCIAIGDGLDYEKYDGNPVITGDLLPKGGRDDHFRDPKIWESNGRFRSVIGNIDLNDNGSVLLYESENGLQWKYIGRVASSGNKYGRMWECPDLFRLDDKDVLLVSPQEMHVEGDEFIEGNTTLCLIGKLKDNGELSRESEQTIDYGLDFYAPQTVYTDDGRRVMIAWMQYWGSTTVKPLRDLPFYGQMTLPRELSVKEGRLIQNPVRELENYRSEAFVYSDVLVTSKITLDGISGRCTDLTVNIRPGSDKKLKSFTVRAAENDEYAVIVKYHAETNTITVDRSLSGWPDSVLNHRRFSVRDRNGEIKIRFILDSYSMELFINDGEQAASFVIFSPLEADGISFEAEGEAVISVERYNLLFNRQ